MKSMKTILMVLLGAALVLSMAGAVAADATAIGDQTLQMKYLVEEEFEITIPTTEIDAAAETIADQVLEVTKNRIGNGKYLQVTLTSTNDFQLKHSDSSISANNIIGYTLGYTATGSTTADSTFTDAVTDVTTSTVILKEDAGSADAKTTLKITVDALGTQVIGNYVDTLTFTIAIV